MRRATQAEKERARRETKREYLDHRPRVWVPALDETGEHWAETVTTETWVYVTARAATPPARALTAPTPRVPLRLARRLRKQNPEATFQFAAPFTG